MKAGRPHAASTAEDRRRRGDARVTVPYRDTSRAPLQEFVDRFWRG